MELIVQYIKDTLVNDEKISKFINDKMDKDYPELDLMKHIDPETGAPNEHAEMIWYGLYNDIFMTIMMSALSNMNSLTE